VGRRRAAGVNVEKRKIDAYRAVLAALRARNYHFVTPTPATHARVVARRSQARDLRDVLGWSLPFARDAIDTELFDLLAAAGVLEQRGALCASRLRVSSLDDFLFLHSAYPTTSADAVFFGPDSYRFAAFLKAELPRLPPRRHIVDVGAGSGVGAVVAASLCQSSFSLTDINAAALELAAANIRFAGNTGATLFYNTNGLDGVGEQLAPIDTIIANPPYIVDPAHRAYRDGGAMHGAEISLRWAREAAARLRPGGALLLYTGSAIVEGQDRFKAALAETLGGFDFAYREIDPDVFGEELEREDYRDVERIAVVGVVAVRRAP
jgi:methylase of polypeptide subunit release factors